MSFDSLITWVRGLNFASNIDPVAGLALIFSAISLTIAWLTYRRDRPSAKVHVLRTSEPVMIGKKQATIVVTNTGRRPITIMAVAYRKLWTFGDVTVFDSIHPTRIDETEPAVFEIDKDRDLPDGKWGGVGYVVAYDTVGKKYTANIAPFLVVQLYQLAGTVLSPTLLVIRYISNNIKRMEDD